MSNERRIDVVNEEGRLAEPETRGGIVTFYGWNRIAALIQAELRPGEEVEYLVPDTRGLGFNVYLRRVPVAGDSR